MRIAYFLPGFPLVSETFVLGQITGMLARGHEVDIYAQEHAAPGPVHADVHRYRLLEHTRFAEQVPAARASRLARALALVRAYGAWRHPGVLVRALDVARYGRTAASLTLLYEALPLLERGAYDVLHCQFGPEGRRVLALRQIGALAGKLVTSFRGYDAPARDGTYTRLFREGELFLPVSRALRDRLVAAGCDPAKVEVLHSGIDLRRFPYAPPRRAAGDPFRLVSIARLVEKKGIAYAIRAVAQLVSAGRRVVYTVVGDGPLRVELARLVEELGADIQLLGWRPHEEAIRLCREAHALVAPSVTSTTGDTEGIPNALKEAMALGLPVIGTHHGGIPELVEDGLSGFLVPERDVAALADRLAALADHPERWAEMGRAGRARIEAEFDAEKLNDRLEVLYRT